MEIASKFKNLALFEQYGALGFDVDYSLIRYNIRNHSKLIYETSINTLVSEFNYPKELFNSNDNNEELLDFGQTSLAIDTVKFY